MRRFAVGLTCAAFICAMLICASLVAGCGSGASTPTVTTTVPPPPTTTTVPGANLEIRPTSGPVGTAFQLLATRFQPAEMVVFEITFPDAKMFKGQAHTASAEGSVGASFRVTSGNPVGTYQVKATGDKGSQATGQFEVVAGASTTAGGHATSTIAGHTSTIAGHTSTTT